MSAPATANTNGSIETSLSHYRYFYWAVTHTAWTQPTDIAQLRQILEDPETPKQPWLDAAVGLAEINTDEARSALVAVFVDMPAKAKVAMGSIRDIDSQLGWKVHLALAQTEELRPDVRTMAVFGLSRTRTEETTDVLMNLTTNAQEEIRCAAIIGLSNLEDSRSIPLLHDMIVNKECSVGNRASAIKGLAELAGDQTETYLSEFTNSDEERVSEAARRALADYRNTAAKPCDVTVSNVKATIQSPGIFELTWDHHEPSVGYLLEVLDDAEHVTTYLTFPGQAVELQLPQGMFICFVKCIVLDVTYSASWEGGVADMCESRVEFPLIVRGSAFQDMSANGVFSSSLAEVLQNPEQFVDQILFFIGTFGSSETTQPLWSSSSRQDWVFSHNGASVIVTNSSGRKYWGKEGIQIVLVAQSKRADKAGEYRMVSIADWVLE